MVRIVDVLSRVWLGQLSIASVDWFLFVAGLGCKQGFENLYELALILLQTTGEQKFHQQQQKHQQQRIEVEKID